MENTFSSPFSIQGKGGKCCARVTLCLFPFSPRGAKARRATFTMREKGCAWFLNRWEESSVLPRYAVPPSLLSLSPLHSLILYYSVASSCPSFHLFDFHNKFSSLVICQFQFCFSIFLSPHPFHFCPVLALSLPFPVCVALDTLPRSTSTLCFPLLTLQCKKLKLDEGELQNIDSRHDMSSHWKTMCFLCLFYCSLQILTTSCNTVPLNLPIVPLAQFCA